MLKLKTAALAAAAALAAGASEKIVSGDARFTVLAPRLVRMEWAEGGKFEDRPTLTFINRDLPDVPGVKKTFAGGGVEIDTGALKVSYSGGGRFTKDNLSVEGAGFKWRPGDDDKGNLLGTARTLDRVTGFAKLMPRMGKGILSRDGWAVVDDSRNHVFTDAGTPDEWVAARPEGARQDLYFFGYGHDYKAALADYVKVAGKIPLPPRWAFGYWWSRYWAYSDSELEDLVDDMKSMGVPLDVVIVDMDWHETWEMGDGVTDGKGRIAHDEFGQRTGWTGYTWNSRYFPDPAGFMKRMHSLGLKTALNLHPASGIRTNEACYAAFCREYGWNRPGESVPYRIGEKKWADAYFKAVISPLEEQGVDFWWLDWQQWATDRQIKGLSSTFWLNFLFAKHSARGGRRPFIYHRWGGLGSHRYQVGFSGDSAASWKMLQAIPYFTATAANVCYGYWGHDIGGFYNNCGLGSDPELFLRWLQSGVFTPVFKTHSMKDPALERRIWMYPGACRHMREAMRLRYALAPYVYTAARQACDTGVSICRPMYYDWPESPEAYKRDLRQYMFGDSILAVTAADPADPADGLTRVDVWLPGGKWYDAATGDIVDGGRTVRRAWTLFENPHFIRPGSMIPMYGKEISNLGTAQDECRRMELLIAPGADSGEGALYEDDGASADYGRNCAFTRFSFKRENGKIRISVFPREGAFRGGCKERAWTIRLPCEPPPARAAVDGRDAGWSFSGREVELSVRVPPSDPAKGFTVEIEEAPDAALMRGRLYGKKGLFARAAALSADFKMQARRCLTRYANDPRCFQTAAQTPRFIEIDPAGMKRHLDGFDAALKEVSAKVDELSSAVREEKKRLDPAFAARIRAWLGL